MEVNDITYLIRGAAFRVFRNLGPGLLESIYHKAMIIELEKLGLKVESELELAVNYEGEDLGIGLRIDLLIEDKVIIELKSIKEVGKIHHLQLLTYMKVAQKKVDLLINFNVEDIVDGIYRKVN